MARGAGGERGRAGAGRRGAGRAARGRGVGRVASRVQAEWRGWLTVRAGRGPLPPAGSGRTDWTAAGAWAWRRWLRLSAAVETSGTGRGGAGARTCFL